MDTTASYKVGDLNRSIVKVKSSSDLQKSTSTTSSTTYLKLTELFSSPISSINNVEISTESPKQTWKQLKKLKDQSESQNDDEDETDNDNQIMDEIEVGKEHSKRRQKRKIVDDNKDHDDDNANKQTIFVGNLPNTFTRKQLRKLFKSFGQIESIRIRSVARSDPKTRRKLATIRQEFHPDVNNMNAYIRFKSENDAKSALTMNGNEVEGFHLRVDMAEGYKHSDNKKSVFLGNLNFKIEEEKVRSHFEDCGEIVAVRLIRDRATRMGKGFGYVLFKNSHSVELALKLNKSELNGRAIRVSRCETNDKVGTSKTSLNKKKSKNSNAVGAFKGKTSRFHAKRRILSKGNRRKSKLSNLSKLK